VGAEVDRYLVHGLLHLVGHDHQRPTEARDMARLEDELLGRAGMVADALEPPPRLR
jgi:probable rRNA maturation factor